MFEAILIFNHKTTENNKNELEEERRLARVYFSCVFKHHFTVKH